MIEIIQNTLPNFKNGFLFIVILACSFFSCKNENEKERIKLEGVSHTPSNFLTNCQVDKKDSTFLYVDKENNIKVHFLEGWDVEPLKEDNLNGLYAIDTSAYLENENVHTLTINFFQLKQNISIKEHFLAELNGLKRDSIPILGMGTSNINNLPAYWFLGSKGSNTKDILFYLKDPRRNDIVVTILISVNTSPSYKDDLCTIFNNIVNQITFLPFPKIT